MTDSIEFYTGTMSYLAARLLQIPPIHTGEWQSKNTSTVPQYATHELMDMTLQIPVADTQEGWAKYLGDDVNLSWAEEHFAERVGGVPVNPAPSHERWPWSRHNGNHQSGPTQIFSHTYPERMWPKHAGEVLCHGGYTVADPVQAVDKYGQADDGKQVCEGRSGIRFHYGDLDDVVDLLVRSPLTRQAYLPLWFPEDTGAVHRQRVPCTLGYHFMIRDETLTMRYYIRSCDLIRHFPDDVYLAGRLMQWVREKWQERVTFAAMAANPEIRDWSAPRLDVGNLTMHIASLHAFTGDTHKLREIVGRAVHNGRTTGQ